MLSNSQAEPGRTVKQEQEEISRNHVQTFSGGSIEVFFCRVNRCVKKSLSLTPSALQFSSQSEGSFRARQTGRLTLRATDSGRNTDAVELSRIVDLRSHEADFMHNSGHEKKLERFGKHRLRPPASRRLPQRHFRKD